MAAISRRKAGYQVQIRRDGHPALSKCFATLRAAQQWARHIENELDRGIFLDRTEAEKQTIGDLLARYAREVSPTHKGHRNETICIKALQRDPLSQRKAAALSGKLLAEWRDRRLQAVSPATVNRELNLISAAINTARKEWGVHIENPVGAIRRPPVGKGRKRRLTGEEAARLQSVLQAGGRNPDGTFDGGARNCWMAPLVTLAIETAMRQGELLKLRWQDINLTVRTAHLADTKNGDARTVPLSSVATATLAQLPRSITGRVFPLTKNAVVQAFQRACQRAGVDDLRFHDLRHEAVSRLFEAGLNPVEIAAISGHRTLAMLSRYAHANAEELARKLG
jgi:integrase